MKHCLLFLSVIYSTFAFSQSRNINPDNLRTHTYDLKVKTLPPPALKLPFASIQIIDSRPDTSIIGFRRLSEFSPNTFKKVTLTNGVRKGIEDFYNQYYQQNFTPNGKVLLISIRKLWINFYPEDISPTQKRENAVRSVQDVHARFEYYIGAENEYVPLQRTDTVFQLNPAAKESIEEDENQLPFFCFSLENMVENVAYDYLKEVEAKKKMSLQDVYAYNSHALNLPILKEPVKTGVYLTLDEFRKNEPSIKVFRSVNVLRRRINEIRDEKDNLIRHYFAYFDGKELFIFSPAFLNSATASRNHLNAFRVQNSFQFFQYYLVTHATSQPINIGNKGAVSVIIPRTDASWVPRHLDLDTGEIY
jgi:hypothetical protein